jgi:hypothetical protein
MANTLHIDQLDILEEKVAGLENVAHKILNILENREPVNVEYRTKEEMCKMYSISSSTLRKNVINGNIKKIYPFGPRSPRYKLLTSVLE